jgi:hypothetical protein|tara:strand:- start:542 stop:832 length:291 start_codon:yes stop_codon:yes gene_type:complete
MIRVTLEEICKNTEFTLNLAARGNPCVVELPEGNVLITPVANPRTKEIEIDKEIAAMEAAAQAAGAPTPTPGVNLPSAAEVQSYVHETLGELKQQL